MHKVLKLNAIKNNINNQVCSYVDHLSPEKGGTILRNVKFLVLLLNNAFNNDHIEYDWQG